ncbi:MarR family transcriptional regulator [Mycobacteriaceae bacterium 1482268.1]|nr:MarR family transcriptional regulator [Mycobacteriaceae bacterium 1482268.1]
MSTMPVSTVAEVRDFNRFYTRVLGLLRPKLAGSDFGLTEARVLFELAQNRQTAVTDLRRTLDLDAGYLSRILSRFIADGLVERRQSQTDARRRLVSLTEAGKAAFATLDSLQADAIDQLVEPLDANQRSELVTAMGRIRRVLDEQHPPSGLVLRAPEPGDLGWVVERHGARYAAEYGWDVRFEVLVARVVADFGDHRNAPPQAAWIAELDGERVGCVFCTASEEPGTAQLRLLLVEPQARGAGVGTRLVDECLRFARRSGYRRITLWTNDVLTAARRIYQRAGFQLDRREPHSSFGAEVVGEYWSRDL